MLSSYQAIFYKEKDGTYSVSFPDLNYLATQGNDFNDAYAMAIDCLAGYLHSLKYDNNAAYPAPSNIKDIEDLIDEVFIDNSTEKKSKIDWEYLKSINEDIIAWIEIEGTQINYPILKDNGNLYYLKHNYLKKYNSNGSIFTLDKQPFEDYETLLYGHNMRNDTMFSLLGNYLDKDFLFAHQKINIYTPTFDYEGIIFSAYSIGIEKEKSIPIENEI